MATVTLRELARNTASVLHELEASRRPALVTRNGKPVAALVPIDETALEDWLLEHASFYTREVAAADPGLGADRLSSVEWQEAHLIPDGDSPEDAQPQRDHLRGSHRGK
jgi:prevent-host-death family protein